MKVETRMAHGLSNDHADDRLASSRPFAPSRGAEPMTLWFLGHAQEPTVVHPLPPGHGFVCRMHMPFEQTSGGQHCASDEHAPQLPPTHAWFPQSRHELHPGGGG